MRCNKKQQQQQQLQQQQQKPRGNVERTWREKKARKKEEIKQK